MSTPPPPPPPLPSNATKQQKKFIAQNIITPIEMKATKLTVQGEVKCVRHDSFNLFCDISGFSYYKSCFYFPTFYYNGKLPKYDLQSRSTTTHFLPAIGTSVGTKRCCSFSNFLFVIFQKSTQHSAADDEFLSVYNFYSQHPVCENIPLSEQNFFFLNNYDSALQVVQQGEFFVIVCYRKNAEIRVAWINAFNWKVHATKFINGSAIVCHNQLYLNFEILPLSEFDDPSSTIKLCVPINDENYSSTSAYCSGLSVVTIQNGVVAHKHEHMFTQKLFTHAKWCFVAKTHCLVTFGGTLLSNLHMICVTNYLKKDDQVSVKFIAVDGFLKGVSRSTGLYLRDCDSFIGASALNFSTVTLFEIEIPEDASTQEKMLKSCHGRQFTNVTVYCWQ